MTAEQVIRTLRRAIRGTLTARAERGTYALDGLRRALTKTDRRRRNDDEANCPRWPNCHCVMQGKVGRDCHIDDRNFAERLLDP